MSPLYNHENIGSVQKTAYLTAKVTSVDSELDTLCFEGIGNCPAGVDIIIFYHCSHEAIERANGALKGASVAFSDGNEVIVQCEITGANSYKPLRVIGFTDKPKSCGWKFKLYRDDDTTIRDGAGNITTPSGLALDIWNFNGIYIFDADTTYGGLPAIRGWGRKYWAYNSETKIWTYDDSIDYPDDAWRGTYNENSGYFTMETWSESPDKLYWVEYETAEPTSISNPARDAAVSTANIDDYIGIIVSLTEAGKSQTLQPPTDKTAGRTFIVKASEGNGNFTITVNGNTLAAGKQQGFTWNESSWGTSDIDLPYGIWTQYPYRYKTTDEGQVVDKADKKQIADKISMGSYEVNIPYWEVGDYFYAPVPIDYTSFPACTGYIGFGIGHDNPTKYWKDNFSRNRIIKSSVDYYIAYSIENVGADSLVAVFKGLDSSVLCGEELLCRQSVPSPPGGSSFERTPYLKDSVVFSSDDSSINKTWDNLEDIGMDSEWFSGVISGIERSISVINNKPHTAYYYLCHDEDGFYIENETTLYCLYCSASLEFQIDFKYE